MMLLWIHITAWSELSQDCSDCSNIKRLQLHASANHSSTLYSPRHQCYGAVGAEPSDRIWSSDGIDRATESSKIKRPNRDTDRAEVVPCTEQMVRRTGTVKGEKVIRQPSPKHTLWAAA